MDPEFDAYAPPVAAPEAPARTTHDAYILEQVVPLLKPREQVVHTAYLVRTPSPWVTIVAIVVPSIALGVVAALSPELARDLPLPLPVLTSLGLLPLIALYLVFFVRGYLTAVTNRRVLLIHTGLGLFRPRMTNRGVEEIRWKHVERIEVGGFANNRSLRFVLTDAPPRTLRIAPWVRFVSGQGAFFAYAQGYVAGERPGR